MTGYKKVAVFGATSGIGRALAERFVEHGSFVIAIGRRQQNLDAFVYKHGKDKAVASVFDITKLETIPHFVEELMRSHPDLDCAFLNSGIQRGINFSKPDTVDMNIINEELVTNYTSQLALTKAFIPFFQAKKDECTLMYTTSGLALIPSTRAINYCSSKAALHHFVLALREQLRESNIRVIEIIPPMVQTELHDEKHQPDLKGGSQMGMPLDEFTDKAWQGILEGKDQIPVGMPEVAYQKFENERQNMFQQMVQMAKQSAGS